MTTLHDPTMLPDGLPVPQDDGGAAHLTGAALPSLRLPATDGTQVDLSRLAGRTVVYVYPRTGRPGVALPEGWDAFPGARGCTPQSCAFRDAYEDFGVPVAGLSAQSLDDQLEFAERNRMPYPVISDPDRRLGAALRLPTFEIAGLTLYKRITLVAENARIVKVFYPVFPPDANAGEVLRWLRDR